MEEWREMDPRKCPLSRLGNAVSVYLQRRGLMRLACIIALALTACVQPRWLSAQHPDSRSRVDPCVSSHSSPKPAGSRFALGFRTSSLGLGSDLGLRLACRFNLRVGFNMFNYSRNLSSDGIAYDSAFRLRSVQALVDWFPFHGGFHLSGGLLVYNGNHVNANAVVPNNQVLSIGNEDIVSNPSDPITGKATSNVRPVSPLLAVGFGNLVPRARKLGFSVDFGVVFQGQPRSNFAFAGSACDPSGAFCGDIAADQNAQAEALADTHTLDKDLFFVRYYPFVSLELGYHF